MKTQKYKSNMDLLQSLKYENISIIKDGQVRLITAIPYYEITKQISKIRRDLLNEGYIYIDGKLKKIS